MRSQVTCTVYPRIHWFIGFGCRIGHTLIPTGDLATIIIAAVMPIVPGVLITNAIQDLLGGHMLMFTTKSLEALVTAFGIGAGVGSVLISYSSIRLCFRLNFYL